MSKTSRVVVRAPRAPRRSARAKLVIGVAALGSAALPAEALANASATTAVKATTTATTISAIATTSAIATSPAATNPEGSRGQARGFPIALSASGRGFALYADGLLPAPRARADLQARQGGTAARLRAVRDAKRGQLAPPTKGGVEAGLAWLEDGQWLQRIRGGWHGFLPTLGGFPSGSGQAFGLIWNKTGVGARYPDDRTANRVDLRLSAAASLHGYYLATFEAAVHRIGGTPIHANVQVGIQRNAAEAFFGTGLDSDSENETSYRLDANGVGALVWWQAPDWFHLGGGIGYRDFDVGSGERDDIPSIEDLFDPPGLDDQGEFLTYDAFAMVDWRNKGNPYRGGLYSVRWTEWVDREFDRFNHGDLDILLEQYVPFLKHHRVLAFRARTILTEEGAGQSVPFYLAPRLGGNNDLRGFEYARFTDKNLLLLSAEYRVQVWLGMDLALFVDAGKVFEERRQLDFTDLKTNYGIGFRLKTTQSTFLRADLAFGGEGFRQMITFDNAFDATPIFSRILRTVQ